MNFANYISIALIIEIWWHLLAPPFQTTMLSNQSYYIFNNTITHPPPQKKKKKKKMDRNFLEISEVSFSTKSCLRITAIISL